MRYFEDVVVGEWERIPAEYELTKEEIVEIARRFDPQPFHIDEEAAKRSVFGGLTACSAHIFGIQSWLGNQIPDPVLSLAAVEFESLRLPRPARAGDRLHALTRCLEKRESRTKPDRGIAKYEVVVRNQNDEPVFEIRSTVLLARRPA